jgi:hypothetical protein
MLGFSGSFPSFHPTPSPSRHPTTPHEHDATNDPVRDPDPKNSIQSRFSGAARAQGGRSSPRSSSTPPLPLPSNSSTSPLLATLRSSPWRTTEGISSVWRTATAPPRERRTPGTANSGSSGDVWRQQVRAFPKLPRIHPLPVATAESVVPSPNLFAGSCRDARPHSKASYPPSSTPLLHLALCFLSLKSMNLIIDLIHIWIEDCGVKYASASGLQVSLCIL